MVKLNEDAFAAVNAAFPDANKTATQATASNNNRNVATTGGSRKGVGASAVESNVSAGTSDIINKRVLQIGSKKRKMLAQEEDDEEDQHSVERSFDDKKKPSFTMINHASDDEDDEEDLGRTSIDKESRRSINPPSVEQHSLPEAGKKKKKKLGKKEREAEKKESFEEVVTSDTTPEKPVKKEILCGTNEVEDEMQKTKKRKRPKVRSKQKNIRKDTRVNKPAHLIPGNGDYRGRPITAETRKRLNMAESRRETKLKAYWSNQNNKSNTDGPEETKY